MKNQSGFSLLEVLVATTLLAVGLLGVAGLIGSGFRSSNSAYYRSQATVLAYDLLDRMRANLPLNPDIRPGQASDYVTSITATDCGTGSFHQSQCSEWKQAVAAALPAGKAAVTVSLDGFVRITIQWNNAFDSSKPEQFDTQSLL